MLLKWRPARGLHEKRNHLEWQKNRKSNTGPEYTTRKKTGHEQMDISDIH